MSNQPNNNYKKNSLPTYLPYSEQCLKPTFLPNQDAINTFIRLIKESRDNSQKNPLMLSGYEVYKRPIAQILSEMQGLTQEQKNKAIEAAKLIEKQPTQKKLECQF